MAADEAVAKLRHQPGFRELPKAASFGDENDGQCFHLDQYSIDDIHWSEGFGVE
jgi:hypothetical protein